MEIYIIKGYDVLLTGHNKINTDNWDKTKAEGIFESKLFNNISYNELILTQEDTDFSDRLIRKYRI